jgi:Zn-dependent protease with chaperone function
MNFFEQQDRSHQATKNLLGLFAGAVLFTGTSIYFAVMLSINLSAGKQHLSGEACTAATGNSRPIPSYERKRSGRISDLNADRSTNTSPLGTHYDRSRPPGRSITTTPAQPICQKPITWFDPQIFFWTMLATSTVVGSASLIKIRKLQAGGAVIAVELGGRRVLTEIATPAERQLLNIVEEMAIAAAIPVPAVYLLDEELGINAFAAGYKIEDAVIGITQGSLNAFTRDELQGVIAHEFSHILNGDMALNIKLTGLLHGILWVYLLGRIISEVGRYSRYSVYRQSGGESLLEKLWFLGFLLKIIGLSGFLSGRLIQSAISRQREFLADASAVQFTRNPDGIANALERIGRESSLVHSPYAETSSHMFFSPALDLNWFSNWFATHPPIADRLKTIRGVGKKLGTKIFFQGTALPSIQAIAPIETSSEMDLTSPSVPKNEASLLHLAHVYHLLLDPERAEEQLKALAQREELAVMEQIAILWQADHAPQLATIDRHLEKIRGTESGQQLLQSSYQLVALLPPENWHNSLAYLILQHRLNPPQPLEIYQSIEEVGIEMRNILGTLAQRSYPHDSNTVFQEAMLRLPAALAIDVPPELQWRDFQTQLAKIAAAAPKIKQLLIAAGLEILTAHRQTNLDGVDLMRSIAILLDCPVPPLLDRLATKVPTPVLHHQLI